jgi:hypothetical protein
MLHALFGAQSISLLQPHVPEMHAVPLPVHADAQVPMSQHEPVPLQSVSPDAPQLEEHTWVIVLHVLLAWQSVAALQPHVPEMHTVPLPVHADTQVPMSQHEPVPLQAVSTPADPQLEEHTWVTRLQVLFAWQSVAALQPHVPPMQTIPFIPAQETQLPPVDPQLSTSLVPATQTPDASQQPPLQAV